MQEEYIVCKSCGREIPKTQFCIYCGVNLSVNPLLTKQDSDYRNVEENVFDTTDMRTDSKQDKELFSSPVIDYHKESREPISIESGLDPEITNLIKELAKFRILKIKLCAMLIDGEVTEKLFTNIYEDYSNRLKKLEDRRNEIVIRYKTQYEEKIQERDNIRFKLEELKVRVALGEITESDQMIRTPVIERDEERLEKEASEIEKVLKKLGTLTIDVSSKDIIKYEIAIKRFLNNIGDMFSNGMIGEELTSRLSEDLEDDLDLLSNMYRSVDEEERSLRNDLETLDIRYKVGEITNAELIYLRNEIIKKLEKYWNRSN